MWCVADKYFAHAPMMQNIRCAHIQHPIAMKTRSVFISGDTLCCIVVFAIALAFLPLKKALRVLRAFAKIFQIAVSCGNAP